MSYFDMLGRYLAGEGWDAEVVGDPPAYFFRFRGQNGDWTCIVQLVEEQARLVFFSVAPQAVPPNRRPAMCELITRLNYGLILGNFEMSLESGDLRFRTTMGLAPDLFSEPLLQLVARTNLAMMDTCLPAINQVLQGLATPAEAFAAIVS